MKKRVYKISEPVFDEIIALKKKYNGMTCSDIAEIVIAKGLVETISPKSVATLLRFGTWDKYQEALAEKNRDNIRRRNQEMVWTQTKFDLLTQDGDKPRMSEAGRIVIENQIMILECLRGIAGILTNIAVNTEKALELDIGPVDPRTDISPEE